MPAFAGRAMSDDTEDGRANDAADGGAISHDAGPAPVLDLDALVAEARRAMGGAYAPYSGFTVGAAVQSDAGVFRGANVENASYGATICAERVAASSAVVAGGRRIQAVAVVSSGGRPLPPCGICRQFLYEFNPAMMVASEGPDGERRVWLLSELVPDGFGPNHLRRT
jgi:cytidine deaminase